MKENKNRVNDKIAEIQHYEAELEQIKIDDFEMYKVDFKTRGLYERYFEKIIGALIDRAYIFIKERKINIPEDEESLFIILFKEGIISEQLKVRLMEAKGMRNIIAHEYGIIDDELVFKSVNDELNKDVEEFIEAIVKFNEISYEK